MTNQKIKNYLDSFKLIYESFIRRHMEIAEKNNTDYIIDFNDWETNANGTGSVNIWIEPKMKSIYNPTFSPFKEIDVKGFLLIAKTTLLDANPNKQIVRFEIIGHFNPGIWKGKNNLNLQPIGKIVTTGSNRIVLEESELFSIHLTKHIQQNFKSNFLKCLRFYNSAS